MLPCDRRHNDLGFVAEAGDVFRVGEVREDGLNDAEPLESSLASVMLDTTLPFLPVPREPGRVATRFARYLSATVICLSYHTPACALVTGGRKTATISCPPTGQRPDISDGRVRSRTGEVAAASFSTGGLSLPMRS